MKKIGFYLLVMLFISCETHNTPKEEPSIPSVPISGTENGHYWVDLGLSVKWATCNIGAILPERYGNYFAWGEVIPRTTQLNWAGYKYCNGTYNSLTKYGIDSLYGVVDNKTILEPEDDAAHVIWGGEWRMPTKEEIQELIDKCNWKEYTKNDVDGILFTAANGNSIFIPKAGYYYTDFDGSNDYYSMGHSNIWSSSLQIPDENHRPLAAHKMQLLFYFEENKLSLEVGYEARCYGLPIRPVLP